MVQDGEQENCVENNSVAEQVFRNRRAEWESGAPSSSRASRLLRCAAMTAGICRAALPPVPAARRPPLSRSPLAYVAVHRSTGR